MSTPFNESIRHQNLRLKATELLKSGGAPPARASAPGFGTLQLLYRLASQPDSAADALRLLSELQVHQVELDLQQEQLELNEREAAEGQARYTALFMCAPVAYLVLNLTGEVLDCNADAQEVLGGDDAPVGGRALASLLTPDSTPALTGLLKQLREGAARVQCQVRADKAGEQPVTLQVAARIAPSGEVILMTMTDPGGLSQE